ncbi:MAG: phenylalanine--tRNA ligase subunit alpha [Armatimonadetes bacterium]|nr:phenylalanine--tRNA ligase subunit alpha [Armatimonadota bacterium]MDW8121045.1 phenylalanine--tRNA ligase subunit alpha [Armatimonadota bacterium]
MSVAESLLERVADLQREAEEALHQCQSVEEVESVRKRFLGRKGALNEILRRLSSLTEEERRQVSPPANRLKAWLEEQIAEKQQQIAEQVRQQRMRAEKLDVTLPGRIWTPGGLHPLTLTINEICRIFTDLGFEVVEGPEVEDEYHNFIALNLPPYHPARDQHDSFYITDTILLRTETSAVQIRVMETRRPPVRIVSPGRVYRRDPVDRTHSHTFHQVEGLLVDDRVTFADLKGTLEAFVRRFFGAQVPTRFLPHHFPFTEPSAEVHIGCLVCSGEGCGLCKGTGWIEVLGCGMVHPWVLENVGYDPEKWQGFAFGMGVERLAMLRFRIDDIRLFYQNDLRFLQQFD